MTRREEILAKAQELVVVRLQERTAVAFPAVGRFEPQFVAEYVLDGEEGRVLMPPQVSLGYAPAEYLLEAQHYTTLDHRPPADYIAPDFVSILADLYGYEDAEVAEVLTTEFRRILDGLFKGRRVSLLEVGDLFVTEEQAGVLLLNFTPNPALIQSLNQPFSVYTPIKLRSDLELPDTEERNSRLELESTLQYAIHEPEPIPAPEPMHAPEPFVPELEVPIPTVVEESVPLEKKEKPDTTPAASIPNPNPHWRHCLLAYPPQDTLDRVCRTTGACQSRYDSPYPAGSGTATRYYRTAQGRFAGFHSP